MQPELMRELITVDAFDRWLQVAAFIGVLAGVTVGVVAARRWTHPRKWALGATARK